MTVPGSHGRKEAFIVDLLRAYAKTTDTTIDDQICDYVEKNLIGPRIEN